ncbi:HEAT repeat domain-containing protein [Tautonia plasticadhaerens]|uniref:HEAT repeat protein n=1 Tax=Tautonia plasticadhaerens TaxID=2527974 RepID=A0A518HC10_9BACT|nr:HEAT repeat domain-containing protein [Tautonia plasticadhaerens]QDV38367.1 HEAT repeat protein [Tautonia plasticadhaerens]
MKFTRVRFRLGLRSLMILVALVSLAVWGAMIIWSPTRRLAQRLRPDQPVYVRREAASTLGSHLIPAWEVDRAVEILIATLDDPSPRVREYAGVGLHQVGPRAGRATPHLFPLLGDEDRYVRYVAARALASIAPPPSPYTKEVVAALERMLDDPDEGVRRAAAESLVELGANEKAVPIVLDALISEDESLRSWAQVTIGRARVPGPFADRLILELGADESRRREFALFILQQVAPTKAFPALRALVEDDRPEIRRWAAEQLDRLTPHRGEVAAGPAS